MNSGHTPMPHIARLPGEPKLVGVPHRRKDSIFSETGVVAALELTEATFEQTSAQRRPIIDQAIGQIARQAEAQQELITGLTTLAQEDVMVNPAKRLNASFLLDTITGRLNKAQPENAPAPTPEQQDRPPVNYGGSWSYNLLDVVREVVDTKKIEKDPYLLTSVGRLVARNDPNDLAIIETGAKLFQRFDLPGSTVEESLLLFERLAHAIDKRKQEVVGFRASTAISNRIILAAGSAMVAKLPLNSQVRETIKLLCQPENSKPFMMAKWLMVDARYNERLSVEDFAHQLSRHEKMLDFMLSTANVDLGEMVTEAMRNMYALRKYGVKPAYFRDGIMHGEGDSWIITGPNDDLTDHEIQDGYESPDLAHISLVRAKEIDDLIGTVETLELGPNAVVQIRDIGHHVYFNLGMFPDGELFLDKSKGVIPLRREFALQGAENAYELLRLAQVMRLVDLVVPAAMVEKMPQTAKAQGRFGRFFNNARLIYANRLIVPRLRLLSEQADQVRAGLDREIDQAEQDTQRRLRQHEVVGHVRVLPSSYNASPEAKIAAAKAGIRLGEHETWVQKHTRGDSKLGSIKSHLAIRHRGFGIDE